MIFCVRNNGRYLTLPSTRWQTNVIGYAQIQESSAITARPKDCTSIEKQVCKLRNYKRNNIIDALVL